ncbi:hypothetical protein ACOMHD_19340 [Xanthomonas codiaei]|uniref:Uncharacterized protein n=1 Tax=Xanthomonas codiaei TaxID=56463 RepID=A0A2S7CH06_9XANT|nr:hypothetical protein [Xanthomonas codiaei]PPU60814.1 hypothetical protein XcodCFBP4690_17180 [Xanthomonas codiaei]
MELNHIVRVARTAKKLRGTGPLSTGESLAAAIVLNKPGWLKGMGYTLAEAINRADDDGQTVPRLLQAQKIIAEEA